MDELVNTHADLGRKIKNFLSTSVDPEDCNFCVSLAQSKFLVLIADVD